MHWTIGEACPADWSALIEECGGGFHHSPAWLRVTSRAGKPVFVKYLSDEGIAGIALGLSNGNHISKQCYFPTLPAMGQVDLGNEALLELASFLRGKGASLVRFGSSEASWLPGPAIPSNGWPRLEYFVDLSVDSEDLAKQFGSTHRRNVRRGCRDGWELCELEGEEAVGILHDVRVRASDRAKDRGDGFAVRAPMDGVFDPTGSLKAKWGAKTFAACDGPTPLSAALVGWAGRRAFYVAGGSTPEGYRRSAAVWLHWSIMKQLAEQGFQVYNLGGTPESAQQPDHPAHGLYRFKKDFGAEIVHRRGARLVASPFRVRAHELLRSIKHALSV